MAAPEYTVAFDLIDAGYRNWWFPLFGVGMGAAFIFKGLHPSERERKLSGCALGFAKVVPWVGVVFMVFWVLGTALSTYADYASLRDDYAAGQYETVEGCVDEFWDGPKSEYVKVGGREFYYADAIVMAGYHDESGAIQPNRRVRLRVIRGQIVRVEVAKAPCRTAHIYTAVPPAVRDGRVQLP